MNIERIFSELAAHMRKGLRLHDQMGNIYGFLNLNGYQRCQEYHYYSESISYKKLHEYFTFHFYKLIEYAEESYENIIPESWYKHVKNDVDVNTKRNAIKETMQTWIKWEQETIQLLTKSYYETIELKNFAAAAFILSLLEDVEDEVAIANEDYNNLESINYDMVEIVDQQDAIYKKYNKKIRKLWGD